MDKNNLINLDIIPNGTKMIITIDTDLYIRIQQVLLEGLPFKDLPHFQACIKEVHDDTIKDPLSYHLHTLLYLCSLIEQSAKSQDKINRKQFDLNTRSIVQS